MLFGYFFLQGIVAACVHAMIPFNMLWCALIFKYCSHYNLSHLRKFLGGFVTIDLVIKVMYSKLQQCFTEIIFHSVFLIMYLNL